MNKKEIADKVRHIDNVYLNLSLTREDAEFAEQHRIANPPDILSYTRALRRTQFKTDDITEEEKRDEKT